VQNYAKTICPGGGRLKTFNNIIAELRKNTALFVLLAPAVVIVLFLNYLPMSGLILAFKDFKYDLGIFGSQWSGFKNFRYLFLSGAGLSVTLNTITYNLVNLLTCQLLAIITAIFVTESPFVIFKKVSQSFIFLPYFISWTIVGMLALGVFNYESGILNGILAYLGVKPLNVYMDTTIWRFIIPIVNSWKWVGYTSVIYIAAIVGVDQECYESAAIDGANIFQKNWHITIPSILRTIIIMVLLNVGRIMRGDFQMFYQLIGNNGQLFKDTDVIDTFVFRALVFGRDFGMASASTFYQSVLCFVIIVAVNGMVRRIDKDSALF
jgi:putative aldouronate transport system permease protein